MSAARSWRNEPVKPRGRQAALEEWGDLPARAVAAFERVGSCRGDACDLPMLRHFCRPAGPSGARWAAGRAAAVGASRGTEAALSGREIGRETQLIRAASGRSRLVSAGRGAAHQGAAARRLEWIQPQGSDELLPTRTHPLFLSSTTTDSPAAITLVEGVPRFGSARTLAPVVVTIRFITESEAAPRTSKGEGANDIHSPRTAGSFVAGEDDLTTVVLCSWVGIGG